MRKWCWRRWHRRDHSGLLDARRRQVIKRVLTFVLFLSMVSPHPLHVDQAAARSPLVFTDVTVVDATGAKQRTDRISALKKTGTVALPPDAQVIDARGKFLISDL